MYPVGADDCGRIDPDLRVGGTIAEPQMHANVGLVHRGQVVPADDPVGSEPVTAAANSTVWSILRWTEIRGHR